MDRGRNLVIGAIIATLLVAATIAVVNYRLYGTERLLPQVVRLVFTALVGLLLLPRWRWARWVGALCFLLLGVPAFGGGYHYLVKHGNLLAGLGLMAWAIVYCGSAMMLLFAPSVRAGFRRTKTAS
jgi:hypothetical protein